MLVDGPNVIDSSGPKAVALELVNLALPHQVRLMRGEIFTHDTSDIK